MGEVKVKGGSVMGLPYHSPHVAERGEIWGEVIPTGLRFSFLLKTARDEPLCPLFSDFEPITFRLLFRIEYSTGSNSGSTARGFR